MVILEIGRCDLIQHLQKILMIHMNPEMSRICCVKHLFEQRIHTQLMIELFHKQKATIRREVAAGKSTRNSLLLSNAIPFTIAMGLLLWFMF